MHICLFLADFLLLKQNDDHFRANGHAAQNFTCLMLLAWCVRISRLNSRNQTYNRYFRQGVIWQSNDYKLFTDFLRRIPTSRSQRAIGVESFVLWHRSIDMLKSAAFSNAHNVPGTEQEPSFDHGTSLHSPDFDFLASLLVSLPKKASKVRCLLLREHFIFANLAHWLTSVRQQSKDLIGRRC